MEPLEIKSQINIEQEMKTAYLDYSMSVIVGRALPDVRDGLKPVHRRVLFGGDNYSAEWHEEAAKRGLPIMEDSVAAFPVLTQKKNVELFRKYGVLSKVELESRAHIAVEKFVKQLAIEADTMVAMGRTMILPAAVRHQKLLADAVTATGTRNSCRSSSIARS